MIQQVPRSVLLDRLRKIPDAGALVTHLEKQPEVAGFSKEALQNALDAFGEADALSPRVQSLLGNVMRRLEPLPAPAPAENQAPFELGNLRDVVDSIDTRKQEQAAARDPETAARQPMASPPRVTTAELLEGARWCESLGTFEGLSGVVTEDSNGIRMVELDGLVGTPGLYLNVLPLDQELSCQLPLGRVTNLSVEVHKYTLDDEAFLFGKNPKADGRIDPLFEGVVETKQRPLKDDDFPWHGTFELREKDDLVVYRPETPIEVDGRSYDELILRKPTERFPAGDGYFTMAPWDRVRALENFRDDGSSFLYVMDYTVRLYADGQAQELSPESNVHD